MCKYALHFLTFIFCMSFLQLSQLKCKDTPQNNDYFAHDDYFARIDKEEKKAAKKASLNPLMGYYHHKKLIQKLENERNRTFSMKRKQILGAVIERLENKLTEIYRSAAPAAKLMIIYPRRLLAGTVAFAAFIFGVTKFYIPWKEEKKKEQKKLEDLEHEREMVEKLEEGGNLKWYDAERKVVELLFHNKELLRPEHKKLTEKKVHRFHINRNYKNSPSLKYFSSFLPKNEYEKKIALEHIGRMYQYATKRHRTITDTLRAAYNYQKLVSKYPQFKKLFAKEAGTIQFGAICNSLNQFTREHSKDDFSATLLMHATTLKAIDEELPGQSARIAQLTAKAMSRLSSFVNSGHDQNIDLEMVMQLFPTHQLRHEAAIHITPGKRETVSRCLLDLYEKFYEFLDAHDNLDEPTRYGVALFNLDRFKWVLSKYSATQHDFGGGSLNILTQQLLGIPYVHNHDVMSEYLGLQDNANIPGQRYIGDPEHISTTDFVIPIELE